MHTRRQQWHLCFALLACVAASACCGVAARNSSHTPTQTTDATASRSPSLQPTLTRTPLATRSQSSSATASVSRVQPPCTVVQSVTNCEPATMAYTSIDGAPADLMESQLVYYTVKATDLAAEGFQVAFALTDGTFLQGMTAQQTLLLLAKSQLEYPFLTSAEEVNVDDYVSTENHGIQEWYEPTATQNGVKFVRTNAFVTLYLPPMEKYRLKSDEWILIYVYQNATAPERCVQSPVIIHVTGHATAWFVPVIGIIALFVMFAGVVASLSSGSLACTHHAGMVAIMAWMHFSQEDGTSLPLAISPTQLVVGTTKYRYVIGAIYGNFIIFVVTFVAQRIAIAILVRRRSYSYTEACRLLLYPRVTAAVGMHLAAPLVFACGRNFGNQSAVQFAVTAVVLVTGSAIVAMTHQVNISSTMQFEAVFVEGPPPSSHAFLRHDANAALRAASPLAALLDKIESRPTHHWEATDAEGGFVIRLGYVFENYKPSSRNWQQIEFIETFLTCLLVMLDNYSAFLAFYQFALTFLLKLLLMVAIIVRKPFLSNRTTSVMLACYGGQVMASAALAISSLRHELLDEGEIGQAIGCCVAILALATDVVLEVTERFCRFWILYRRRKWAVEYDETTERRLQLTEDLLRAKTQDEIYEEELVKELRAWVPPPSVASAAAPVANAAPPPGGDAAEDGEDTRVATAMELTDTERAWMLQHAEQQQRDLRFLTRSSRWARMSPQEQFSFFKHLYGGPVSGNPGPVQSDDVVDMLAEALAPTAVQPPFSGNDMDESPPALSLDERAERLSDSNLALLGGGGISSADYDSGFALTADTIYDSDGIRIDRYHTLYPERQRLRRQRRDALAAQVTRQATAGHMGSSTDAARTAENDRVVASFRARMQQEARLRSRSDAVLAQEWLGIARAVEPTHIRQELTEQDYLDL